MSVEILKNIYLFKGLSEDQLNLIDQIGEEKTCIAGDTVFSQGDSATALFIIRKGTISIDQSSSSGDPVNIARLGNGSHFGEMSLLDGEARSASAQAREPSELIELSFDSLTQLLNEHKDIGVHVYRELAHFLCGRLRVTTTDLSFAKEKNLRHF